MSNKSWTWNIIFNQTSHNALAVYITSYLGGQRSALLILIPWRWRSSLLQENIKISWFHAF
jgi:hypothetical protein